MSSEDRRATLETLIQALPQYPHLKARCDDWLGDLLRTAGGSGLSPERQVQRLAGFGGSEIGVLVSEQRGEYDPFDTAREVCQRKLLLASQPVGDPFEPGAMQRGTDLEPLIRVHFHAMTGAQSLTDELSAVQAHRHREHPWMLYTPDDLVQLHGLNILVDYKAPFTPPSEVALRYGCQLHQGALLAEDAGIMIDRLLLVAWDLQHWKPLLFMVERDQLLVQDMIQAGEHYWPMVLEGQLPPWPQRNTTQPLVLADMDDTTRQCIEQAALDYARLDILAKEAKRAADLARTQLEALSAEQVLADEASTGAVKLKPTTAWNSDAIESRLPDDARAALEIPKWDANQLAEMVRQLGGDPTPASISVKLNVEQAAQWLIEHHQIPSEMLQDKQVKASLSRRKADQVHTDALRDVAATTLQQHRAMMPGL